MAEQILIPESADRETRYELLLPQLEALIAGETDLVANISNVVAALREAFGFFWVGVYFVKEDQLVLGPFQGPVACTRIGLGKGVCGTAWQQAETILVPDVDLFPGHIACSSASRSEVVVPGFSGRTVVLVLDVDSDKVNDFSEVDVRGLERVMRIIERVIPPDFY
ncbi:MAG: GAF domain-containing protein [Bacteroidota bacterium]